MTQEFEELLRFFGSSALGYEYTSDSEVDISSIYRISTEQGIWQTVYISLSKCYDLSKYQNHVLNDVAKNIRRNEFVRNIVDKLEHEGIGCCYLKGITVARFYSEPDCRISGDTDILIKKDDVGRVRELLNKYGFDIEKNEGNMHHFEARHKIGGLLEVHIALYQKYVDDMLFKNLLTFSEEYIFVDIDGYKIKTLGINDGLNHLTAHYIKHFINKGVGVRQLMDLLLYMKYYQDEINWEEYNKMWKEIGFYNLIEILKGIGVKYWNMNFKSYSTKYTNDLLTDIENGGLFGFNEVERKEFFNIFLAEKNRNNIGEFKKYMDKNYSQKFIWRLFPNKEYMVRGGYSHAAKGTIYLFFAYLQRIKVLALKFLKKEKKFSETVSYEIKTVNNDIEKERLELMRKIGVID